MRQFSILFALVVFWACYFGTEARSQLACVYGPNKVAVIQNQFFIESREDDRCLRRVDCTQDLKIKILECKDFPCAADKKYNQVKFPDCCCGGRRNFS